MTACCGQRIELFSWPSLPTLFDKMIETNGRYMGSEILEDNIEEELELERKL